MRRAPGLIVCMADEIIPLRKNRLVFPSLGYIILLPLHVFVTVFQSQMEMQEKCRFLHLTDIIHHDTVL